MKPKNLYTYLTTAGVFALFLAADILTKYLVETNVGLYQRIDVLGSFVQITKIYNRGGVFGIMQGHQMFFLIVSLLVFLLLLLFYVFEKNKNYSFAVAMGLIFSGAIGNILDRLMGKPGVVDFVYIGDDSIYRWPAFNVADAAIVVGAFLLIIVFYLQEKKASAEKK
ncbi:MAG: signal peptidase II [Spirochaetota bacterium]